MGTKSFLALLIIEQPLSLSTHVTRCGVGLWQTSGIHFETSVFFFLVLIVLRLLIDGAGIETECDVSAILDDLILALRPRVESENSSKSVHDSSMASNNNQHNHLNPSNTDKDGLVLVNRLNESRSPYVGFSQVEASVPNVKAD